MCAAYPNPTCLILKLEFNVAQKQGSCTGQEIRFVIYGILECQQGTPRHTRMSSDPTSTITTVQNLASKYAPKYLFRRNLPAKINPVQRVNKQIVKTQTSLQISQPNHGLFITWTKTFDLFGSQPCCRAANAKDASSNSSIEMA